MAETVWKPEKPVFDVYDELGIGDLVNLKYRKPFIKGGPDDPFINDGKSVSERDVEGEIRKKGLNAPRVTPVDIDACIASESYHVFEGTNMTVCCLILTNGFPVTGESCCVSKENFNAELGRKIARNNARDKIWLLEGYLLKDRLYRHSIGELGDSETPLQ